MVARLALGQSADDAFITRDDYGNGYSGWELKGTEDCDAMEHFAIQVATTTSTTTRCSLTIPSPGVWYHVAGVYDAEAQEMHVYVNGVLDDGILSGLVPASQVEPASGVHAQIGNSDPAQGVSGGDYPFDGKLDEVRFYTRALNAGEIAAIATP